MTEKELIQKVDIAKEIITINHTRLSKYAMRFQIVFDTDIPIASTDMIRVITLNPNMLEAMSVDEVSFVLMHETLHTFLNHRHFLKFCQGKYSAKLRDIFNISLDAVINSILIDKLGFKRPTLFPCVYEPKYNNSTEEQVANELLKVFEDWLENNPQKPPPPPPPTPRLFDKILNATIASLRATKREEARGA